MANIYEEIDFNFLREQKETLVNLTMSDRLTTDENEKLIGLVSLIDNLQENAIEFGIDLEEVYGELLGGIFKNAIKD